MDSGLTTTWRRNGWCVVHQLMVCWGTPTFLYKGSLLWVNMHTEVLVMSEGLGKHGPFHRLGEPGGLGCPVGVLPITFKGPDGFPVSANLLDAGTKATELELLRTVVQGLGVRWGHDNLGWWAVVPNPK